MFRDKINNNKMKYLSFHELFSIYPGVSQQNDNLDEIHKFYELFKKPVEKKENTDKNKLTKSVRKSVSDLFLKHGIKEIIKNAGKNLSISISNQNSKKESTESNPNENIEIEEGKKEEMDFDYYLIKKGILLQNKKKKRSDDVKGALELFLMNSTIIEKLTNNLSVIEASIKKSQKTVANKKPEKSADEELQKKIKEKLKAIVSKLAEKVIIKKYPKNKFIIKMNEIGDYCYFLLSGKASILKPAEIPGIKMTYKEYLIYLKKLLDLKELDLLSQVLSTNQKFLEVVNIDELTRLIKVYFVSTLKNELDKKLNGISLSELESHFKEFNYKFEDFNIKKEKMLKEIETNQEIDSNVDIMLRNYILDHMQVSTEDSFLLDIHNIFNIEKEKKAPPVKLYRYEHFLNLYPGSFFGDSALEDRSKKRNASIRTEEDSIICCLSNKFYLSLIAEENKKLKTIDLQFLLNNFFFHEISANIFKTYYYDKFKLCDKKKNEVIFKSNQKLSSVYLLKDGTIKTEISANVKDLIDLVKNLIKGIYTKSASFKIDLTQLTELRNNYLKDDLILEKFENKDYILSDKQDKHTYNLYYSNGFECLGIIEHCLDINFITTSTVVSDKAVFMEIKKEDLNRIIQNDKEVLPNYFNYVYMNAISLTKRLYFLKNNILNKIINNFNEKKKDKIIFIENNFTNNHKQKVEILNSEKMKTIYKQKKPRIKDKINRYSTKKINLSPRKNLSNFSKINDKPIKKEETSLLTKDYSDMTNSLYTKRRRPKTINKYSMKIDENEKNKDIKDSPINIRNKILSLNSIKKNIVNEFFKNKNFAKLNIVSKFRLEEDKSVFEDLMNNKYRDEKSRSPEEENSPNKTKETISNYLKSIKHNYNTLRTVRKERSTASLLPHIKNTDKRIKKLIKEMKQKHSINLGQRKFIIYQKSKANKVYNNLFNDKNNESCRQNSARNLIKDYYLKKKIEGYSSIVNPTNNTYINRQKTVRVKNVNISQ